MTKSLTAIALLALTASASAATLTVGTGKQFDLPSDAARAAGPGDTIKIEPGIYHDCAVWNANDLTIDGQGAVVTGDICEDKALFVISGSDVTVRGLTFLGANSADGNAAGIRAEGVNLTVEKSAFTDNQDGILAGNNPASTIVIRDSTFRGNGACLPDMGCAHGVYVGHIRLLQVEHSIFSDTQAGHDIKSRAFSTEVVGNRIEDGPTGTSSYLVDLPNGGALTLRDNTLEKGPNSSNHSTAVAIGEEGVTLPAGPILVIDNHFTNDGPRTVFVKNETSVLATLHGNVMNGSVEPLSGSGVVR